MFQKITDWMKANVKTTMTVIAFGVGLTIGWNASGCEFDVAPAALVEDGGAGGTEAE